DYRYFPDPDLEPLILNQAWVEEIAADLPELPDAKRARFMSQYGLSRYDAGVLTAEMERAEYFERAAAGRDAKLVANWLANELLARLSRDDVEIDESPIGPADLAGLVELIETGVISTKIAREVMDRMWAAEGSAGEIVEREGLAQMSDAGELKAIIEALITANPGQAAAVAQRPQAIGWFVGQVMRQTAGKANPGEVNAILRARLLPNASPEASQDATKEE
ncbi:MAG: Asp-tRNA(Asn)/Glu-tRNA(Gln) amidotransferase subunit GatB, partial [Caulobacteraceae bacterium]